MVQGGTTLFFTATITLDIGSLRKTLLRYTTAP